MHFVSYTINVKKDLWHGKIKEFIRGTGSVSLGISEVDCVYNVGYMNGEKCYFINHEFSNRKKWRVDSQVIHIDIECVKKVKNTL